MNSLRLAIRQRPRRLSLIGILAVPAVALAIPSHNLLTEGGSLLACAAILALAAGLKPVAGPVRPTPAQADEVERAA